jgi:hypothetical protein
MPWGHKTTVQPLGLPTTEAWPTLMPAMSVIDPGAIKGRSGEDARRFFHPGRHLA